MQSPSIPTRAPMTMTGMVGVLMFVTGLGTHTILAQDAAPSRAVSVSAELEPITRALLRTIESLSDYRAPEALPPVFQIHQNLLEAKICEEPCSVTAAYVPREGIYLAESLDPVHESRDRAALLHELVHYLQQGHPKFAQMDPCERERMKEQEAYAIQNAYLAMIGSPQRAVFYDGAFDCEAERPARSP